jgi:quinol monooxygenase YgiN
VVRGIQIDIDDIQVRLGTVEDKLHPHISITDEQAAHISTVVKALAELLTRQKGKNQYQSVFAELYRRFGVSSYKHIRQEQYSDVLAFLEEWRDAAMEGHKQQEGTGDA